MANNAAATAGTTMPPRMPSCQTPQFRGGMAAAAPAVAMSPSVTSTLRTIQFTLLVLLLTSTTSQAVMGPPAKVVLCRQCPLHEPLD